MTRLLAAALLVLGACGSQSRASAPHPTTPAPTPEPPTTHPPMVVSADTAVSTATRVRETVQVAEPPPTDPPPPPVPEWAQCGQWWPLARAVGWAEEDLPVIDSIMHGESRCDPGAIGALVCHLGRCARALGLMQLLGWSCPPAGCLDPASNLTEALHLRLTQGWRPWCGEPIVGRC